VPGATSRSAPERRSGHAAVLARSGRAHGFLIVAPLSDRGWMQIGTSLLFAAIARMQRDFHVDPDRIFLTGHSMGGHLTWRSAFWFTDHWAAVSPMSGGYDYVKSQDVWNLVNVPGYTTFGTDEPYQINEFNRTIAAWMRERSYPWTCAEKQGGHTIFPDEVAKVASFFAGQRRDLYRKKVWARIGAVRFATAESNPQWDKEHTWNAARPLELSTMFWLRFSDPAADVPPEQRLQKVFAEVQGGNRIVLTSEHVRRLRVHLHPRMVDFQQGRHDRRQRHGGVPGHGRAGSRRHADAGARVRRPRARVPRRDRRHDRRRPAVPEPRL
jgi:dienelactone hydrolase